MQPLDNHWVDSGILNSHCLIFFYNICVIFFVQKLGGILRQAAEDGTIIVDLNEMGNILGIPVVPTDSGI